jgi:hypothetical protein
MPTVAELNRVAPQVPVLVLFGYSEVLNRAGAAALVLLVLQRHFVISRWGGCGRGTATAR